MTAARFAHDCATATVTKTGPNGVVVAPDHFGVAAANATRMKRNPLKQNPASTAFQSLVLNVDEVAIARLLCWRLLLHMRNFVVKRINCKYAIFLW